MNEEDKELKQAMDWLAGLDIHSHSEAYYKELLLSTIEQEKEKNKKLEEENKYLQDYLEGMEGGLHEQIREQQKQISELYEELEGNR